MLCQVLNCEKIAPYPYKACGAKHGSYLRDTLKWLKEYWQGELSYSDFYSGYGWKDEDFTVEKVIYYANLLNWKEKGNL